MAATQSNTAAWLPEAKVKPFAIKSAPVWQPSQDEILIRNHAVAINPIDGMLQDHALYPLNYPTILGNDVAGEVVAVGPNVTDFKAGNRVLGNAVGMATQRNSDGAFQEYMTLRTNMAAVIPDNITYEQAAVIPLCCSTAAAGLFQETHLNIQLPTEPAAKPTGKTVVIYGGASSVGSNAIQLSVAAGYEVVTTCSTKNFEYVKSLGASQVVDSYSPSVTADLVKALDGKTLAGCLDCIGSTGWKVCLAVVDQVDGHKFVATTKRGFPEPPLGVEIKHIFAVTIKDNNVGKAVYGDFLPKALAAGTFKPAPEAEVVGKGLEDIQEAIGVYQKGGVSAKKIVVSL